MDEPVFIYIVGTAGSGKSRFTAGFKRWMYDRGLDAVTVNLDPGAEQLPYDPDVDIRDWIVLSDVMHEYGLGPNGAQVTAADLIALRAPDVKQSIESFRPDYVLVDTPGQIELFVFREAGRVVTEFLGPGRSIMAFLIDPFLARRPSAFVSQTMLSATTHFRFQMPLQNVITKQDLLKPDELERIKGWAGDPDRLLDDLMEEQADMYNQLSTDVFRALEGMGGGAQVVTTSSETLEGIEDVYTFAQATMYGAEDLSPD